MDNDNGIFGQDNLFPDETDEFDNLINNSNNNQNMNSNSQYENQFMDTVNDADDSTDTGKLKKTAIIIAGVGLALIIIVVLIAGALSKKDKQVENNSTVNNTYTEKIDPNKLMNTAGNNVDNVNQNKVSTPDYNTWTELNDNTSIDFKDYIKANFTITDIKHYVRNSSPDGTYIVKTTLTGMISGYSGTYTLDVPYNKGIILATNPDLGIGCTFEVSILIGEYNGKKFIGDITTNVNN